MENDSKNAALLESFTKYCREHPEYRFWQALRNWSNATFIKYVDQEMNEIDTFYW